MAKVSCSVIQDLLPLYCDDVCSADSREMIEAHLQECAACSEMLRLLQGEYHANTQEIIENKGKEAVLGKMSRGWKRSLLKTAVKALLVGILSTTLALSIRYGVHDLLFVQNREMVLPEQVTVNVYSNPKISDQQISVEMQPSDGYWGGTMDAYADEEGNLYISILRSIVKDAIPEGENEIMIYGFDQAQKNYTAVYYGKPDNCKLIWEPGDMLPDARE